MYIISWFVYVRINLFIELWWLVCSFSYLVIHLFFIDTTRDAFSYAFMQRIAQHQKFMPKPFKKDKITDWQSLPFWGQ